MVTDADGNAYVWRYDTRSQLVHKNSVSIGEMAGANILVTEGLEGGDSIAVAGAAHLREGMKVRPLTKK